MLLARNRPVSHSEAAAIVAGGGLPERTNGTVSKTVVAARSPWVQIPHPPPEVRPGPCARAESRLDRCSAAADGLGSVALQFGLEVEGLRADLFVAREPVGRDDPADLELEAVGIFGIEALGGAVI